MEVIEVFAGTARLARLAKALGIPSEAHDITYDANAKYEKSCMDINEPAGYVLLSFLSNIFSVGDKEWNPHSTKKSRFLPFLLLHARH